MAHVMLMPAAQPQVGLIAFYPADKTQTTATLEKIAKELHVDRYECTNLLNSGEYQLLSVDAPNVPQDELKTAIRWRLKDMLDFHIDDATIDVLDIPGDKNAPERKGAMYAVAAHDQFIKQHQSLFEQVGIPLSVIDIPEMAQRNISALLEPEDRGLALLSFDNTGGLLTITFAGELYLSRRLDVTLAQLLQTDIDQKNTCYDRVTLELQRSFDHFERQFRFIAVSKLMLAPLGDGGSGLQEYLAANLYMPVETFNLDAVLDISKVPELQQPQQQQFYFMALGAALRHEVKTL
ncbi:MAG TPA: agglutinin biogenesis protein MshI [Betaproteobacteria bacterium]|nr:agglutinin biogenesis protein MshI [Betaproteobacteria bacterium]